MNNPLGTNGFAFVEFATNDIQKLENDFKKLGFALYGKAKNNKEVYLYKQGHILFIINNSADSQVSQFYKLHGNSACSMGFYIENPELAILEAQKSSATVVSNNEDSIWFNIPAIYGIGNSIIYFIGLDNSFLNRFELYNIDNTNSCGLEYIDHLTHNVRNGQMAVWADFYIKIFGFYQIRYFDIDGKKTGLFSKAMTSPCGKIKIPLNESKDDKSQIAEFINEFNGEGIQHIALTSKNIYDSVINLKEKEVRLLDTPDTYYELIEKRLPNHGEKLELLQQHKILIDGVTAPQKKLLLQIFTENMVGPAFFEIIQRKGDEGFGEGNFQALFDSIELDQMRRGVL